MDLSELARRQHGVVARFQLLLLGFTTAAIRHRLEEGRLHRLHRGVYAVGHRKLTAAGRTLAAVLACGRRAVASHRTAAWLHALLMDARAVTDVTVPGSARRREGIRVHRARHLHREDIAIIDGIPCTSVARTLLDLAATEPVRRVERAMEEAERRGSFDLAAIERVCARCSGHRGVKPLRALVGRTHAPPPFTRSQLERRFFERLREQGLPLPAVNNWVEGQEVDLYWPDHNLVVELDTRTYHAQRAAFETDRARDAKLQVAGNAVLRITGRRYDNEEDAVLGEVRALLA